MTSLHDPIDRFLGAHSFLANPYSCVVVYQGITFPSSEHAFHAMKTKSKKKRLAIAELSTWQEAKAAGRMLDLRSDWEEIKDQVMLEILRAKFSDKKLKDRLLATEPRILIEGNGHGDNYWGALRLYKHVAGGRTWIGRNGSKWYGRNQLGVALMQVRKELSVHSRKHRPVRKAVLKGMDI